MADPTIWPLEPHTGVKHEIYDRYLDAWLPIILGGWKSATYAEGYAGPGVYKNGEPGSPIRALRRLRNAQASHPHLHDRQARLVLVEKRPDRVARLLDEFRRELNHPMPDGEYEDATLRILVRKGPCNTALPPALNHIGAWDGPVLAVLDSFGGGNTQDLLRHFAGRAAGEVIVTVDPQHFVRNLDPERANEVFGSDRWRRVDRVAAPEKRQFIAEQLVEAVRQAGFKYVISFGLHSVRGGDLLLQFGTNHIKGVEKFKDSLWRADPISGARFQDPNDPDQMLLDLAVEADVAPLRRLLAAQLDTRPGRTATIDELREYTLEHTIFKTTHAAPALEQLRARQAITTDPNQKSIVSRTPGAVKVTSTGSEQGGLF